MFNLLKIICVIKLTRDVTANARDTYYRRGAKYPNIKFRPVLLEIYLTYNTDNNLWYSSLNFNKLGFGFLL